MDLNDQPESIQHSMTFAENITGHQQTNNSALPVQQTVRVIPEHERKSYPAYLTDAQWQRIVPLLPPAEPNGYHNGVELREVLNGILYVACDRYDWRSFPHDLPPMSTVYYYFRQWRLDGTWQKILDALHPKGYEANGHEELPGATPGNSVAGEAISNGHIHEQEPSQNAYLALSVQPPATPDSVPVATLPALLSAQDNLSILDRHTNFFVLATCYVDQQPMLPRASNGASQEEERNEEEPNREVKSEMQTSVLATVKETLVAAHAPAWLGIITVTAGLMVSFVAHSINMFNYPHYELDEGTYMSSAWAILNGMITAYPYGYGHPPLAWIQIAGWVQLTGGFFTFGTAINSGRVLMLLFAFGCSLLVYLIARQISNSRSAGLLAMVLFSLSPISLTLQRQVFLDNVGTFWLLLSLYLILISKSRLSYLVLAALSFGFAFLSKEVFLFFMPVLIYTAWLHSTRYQRKFTIIVFTYIIVACGFAFVLIAVLKGELFPYDWHLPWDHHPHLSMLDTFIHQVQRGQVEGKVSDAWFVWTHTDPLLIEVGIIAIAFNLLVGLWNHKHLLILLSPFRFFKRWRVRDAVPVQDKHLLLSLLAISFWLLLVRGGVVYGFYIIPMIPLLALNIAAAISLIVTLIGKLVRFKLVCALLIFAIIGVILPYDLQHAQFVFDQHPTDPQKEALVWVRNHVPHSATIVINGYLYLDLRESNGLGVGSGVGYPYAHVYWNVAYDPEVRDQLLHGNWDRIDYIVADWSMLQDIKTNGEPMMLISTALQHSILRAEFRTDDQYNQIDISIYQVMHKQVPPILSQVPGGASPTFIDRRWATATYMNHPRFC
jgi:transposase/4-amino-4-deoxy-L-arabinose transferase-like glycosyltransferase